MSVKIKSKLNYLFDNSILGILFNPFYFTRKELYNSIKGLAPSLGGKVVDIGCGTKPYKHLFTNSKSYIGVDIEVSGNGDNKNQVDIFYNGTVLPFENASIDHVFSSETFEHVFNLETIISEIQRVTKKDGLLLITCPFTWPEHEIPYDFARYSSFGIRSLIVKNNFEIVEQIKTGNYVVAMIQLLILYIYFFINKIPLFNKILFILCITPLMLLGILLNNILPKIMLRKDLYLNNVILARKL